MSHYYSEHSNKISVESYWESINILITKPHVINKRLWGNKVWFKNKCFSTNPEQWESPNSCKRLNEIVTAENIEQCVSHIYQELKVVSHINFDSCAWVEVILIELLPKNYSSSHAYQLICLDKNKLTVTFYDVTPETSNQNVCPNFPYCLKLKSNEIVLISSCDLKSKSYEWVKTTVLPQVRKWAEGNTHNDNSFLFTESLSLVSKTKYYKKYNDLKIKYGKELVKIWPECTDPSKFVYEDVAIATYLLLLWEEDNLKKQSFVDLGCGNGLLVYILTKEGHAGVGIDVRKRQIWDMFSDDVRMEEKTITPSDVSLFPDADWIIGNHSDELTPWIPVITAKSSFKCNFFLLPCCTYNFDGTKYQRRNSCKSQYTDYLEYIKELCEECGFSLHMDRLKIPSTKRICLVSKGRTYSAEVYYNYCDRITQIIDNHNNKSLNERKNYSTWINDFKPRETIEKVRNCTQVDKTVIESIVNRITNYLLPKCNSNDTNWSSGKIIEINKVVQLIPQEQLNILKSECGGIKTLLKNNHHIFKVESGKVQLRFPRTIEEVNKNIDTKKKLNNLKIQQRPCWFYNNHPQGCPLSEVNCSFLHVKS